MSKLNVLNASAMMLAYQLDMFDACGEVFGNFNVEGLKVPYGEYDCSTFANATFDSSDFAEASFEKANLTNVTFTGTDLSKVNFSGAELEDVSFLECNLTKANFQYATLKKITMTDCIGGVDLSDADVQASIFYKNDMATSSFHDTHIKDTVITSCDLSKSFISKGTELRKVRITLCDITELSLSIAKVRDDIEIFECEYRPHFAGQIKKIKIKPGLGRERILAMGRNTTYVNYMDFSAHLYCSDLEEYKDA